MANIETDVAIIGAGTAGLAAERHAREEGARTLLIDEAFAGTTCANDGCMPSKLLIAAGEAAHGARHAGEFGIELPAPQIDGTAVMKRVRRLRDHFVTATKKQFETLPDGVCVQARAQFTGQTRLSLDTGDTVSARAIVIATGAKPVIPEPFKAAREAILTHETIFDLEDLPASIGVIGAGPLGLELAQALSRLGVRVEVFDMGNTLAGLPEGPSEASLRAALQKEFPVHLSVGPSAELIAQGVRLTWGENDEQTATFDRLLIAAGRAPHFNGLGLDAAGLELDEHGTPVFDSDTLQCAGSPVFIAGDANHDRPILHEASAEGTIAGRNAARYPDCQPLSRKVLLQIMFTEPNMARIGQPGEETSVTGRVDFGDQGRARVMARNQGVSEIYADARDGRLMGACLVGPGVEHMAHLIAWAVQSGTTATDLLDQPFYHPTLEEGLKTALQQICKAVSAPRPPERDDGFLPGES